MDPASIIARTVGYVRDATTGEGSGHDWWHIHRVWQTARTIGQQEEADLLVVELAALLHDIADWKFHDGDESVGPRVAGEWLSGQGVDPAIVTHVQTIIRGISFKGESEIPQPLSLEGQVVQDADRLDALGAVGVARVFAYCGYKSIPIYDPDQPPRRGMTAREYKKTNSSGINHFYEKLLLLKDRMNTATGRQMAAQRHRYLEGFLAQFFMEWPGITPPQP